MDAAQEQRIDDLWNVDGYRNLSDSWTGFTRFTFLNETPPKGFLWSGGRLTKIQTTSRPDHIWPDAWTRIGKAAQRREKQEWAIQKPKLEHARKLRGIYSIDPSDEEYKDIIKNAWRCHVKERFLKHAYGKPLFHKQKKPRHLKQRPASVVSLKAHESTRTKNRVSNEKDS